MNERNDAASQVAIAPHQVYGPRDMLFLHNFLLNAKRLRVFGPGDNLVSVCYVDNYCHGLIIGERALYPGSPAGFPVDSFPRICLIRTL